MYKDWKFEVDFNRTKEVYDKIEVGSPESCGCNDCKNFVENRIKIYPEEIKELLAELGINFKKESEIYHICKLENGYHHYGGWFHFKGKITEGKDCKKILSNGGSTFDTIQIADNFRIAFMKGSDLAFLDKDESSKLMQIEFIAESEWVINEEIESE